MRGTNGRGRLTKRLDAWNEWEGTVDEETGCVERMEGNG